MTLAHVKKKAALVCAAFYRNALSWSGLLFVGLQATIYQHFDFNTLVLQTVFLGLVTCYRLADAHCGRINNVPQWNSLLMQEIDNVLSTLLAQLLVPIGTAAGASEALHINQVAFHSPRFFR